MASLMSMMATSDESVDLMQLLDEMSPSIAPTEIDPDSEEESEVDDVSEEESTPNH